MNSPKKIGIWGSGVVGRSAIKYFSARSDYQIVALADKKEPDAQFLEFLGKYTTPKFYPEENIQEFLEICDGILPSPGIDLRKYSKYKHKFITEADIFAQNWDKTKPVIAITGTVGKTSVVTLLSKVLEQNNLRVATGGNIGTGMLDLLENQENYDIAVLELSSFQLEYCKIFAPDLAIITNIFPNHLDRHGDMQNYLQAKFNIFLNQNNNQKLLVPEELRPQIENLRKTDTCPAPFDTFFSLCSKNTQGERVPGDGCIEPCGPRSSKFSYPIPDISYPVNWVIIFKACEIMGIEIKNLDINNLEIPDHRVEFVREFNGIEFYDDSKSTVCQATLAAVEKLNNKSETKPIILFLGGISKGVDRSGLIKDLKNKVSEIICFGSEAENLNKFCIENSIPSSFHKTLEEAFSACISSNMCSTKNSARVLFSPSGASFDLFKDYKDRGNKFKNLVNSLK